MIKNFDVWPLNVDKNNLLDEQKIFIIYLMGIIPENKDWMIQVEYQKKLEEIKRIKTIKLEKTDVDLANLQNRSIKAVKKERLIEEKKKQIKELNDKFGIENEEEEIKIDGLPESVEVGNDQKKMLWELLHGKGLIKKKVDG